MIWCHRGECQQEDVGGGTADRVRKEAVVQNRGKLRLLDERKSKGADLCELKKEKIRGEIAAWYGDRKPPGGGGEDGSFAKGPHRRRKRGRDLKGRLASGRNVLVLRNHEAFIT